MSLCRPWGAVSCNVGRQRICVLGSIVDRFVLEYVEMCSVLIRYPDKVCWMYYTLNSLFHLTSPFPGPVEVG
jgi:hypothetical protein